MLSVGAIEWQITGYAQKNLDRFQQTVIDLYIDRCEKNKMEINK